MMKTKTWCLLTLLMLSLPMSAQKLFTLEDLNFGGTNYRNMQPQNMWLTCGATSWCKPMWKSAS